MNRQAHIAAVKDLLAGVRALRYQPTQHGAVELLAAAMAHVLILIDPEAYAAGPDGEATE